ncbi:WXG100 family type VII secretion target [Saccharothrix variisporea]|uniref:Uncharacterized protein n=1 Tax=Saccharothrix variisporea TaxID=543527 RepID=A0A495X210_9PSEU|nr:hypothetical protein [Saccharothrix variisporea]RKT67234.1 hypothetical protein DFJ66_0403 [Saccharothrix variisporea]
MPPGRIAPNPDHPLIRHLNGDFGNAQYMIAWLHRLYIQLEGPMYPGYDRYLDMEHGNPYYFGITTEDYLHPLDVLSGQDIALMESVHHILESARYKNDNNRTDDRISQFVFNDLNADLERAQNTWKGATADSVHQYRKDFQNFYPEHQKAIGQLGNCLVAYAGVIREARKDVDKIVGQFYDALENYYYSSSFPLDYVIVVLDLLVGFIFDKLPLKPTEERIFSAVLGKAISDAGTQAGQSVGGDDLLDIAKAYLTAANDVCDKAKAQIRALTERLRTEVETTLLNMGPVPVPSPPATVSDGFEVDLGVLGTLVATTASSIAYFEQNARDLHIGASGVTSGYPLLGGQGGSGAFFHTGKDFSDAFVGAYQRVTDTYQAFIDGLKRLHQGLQDAYDTYNATETQVRQSFGSLAATFGKL